MSIYDLRKLLIYPCYASGIFFLASPSCFGQRYNFFFKYQSFLQTLCVNFNIMTPDGWEKKGCLHGKSRRCIHFREKKEGKSFARTLLYFNFAR